MKPTLKAANAKARALLAKLRALAERGIDGERASAERKIALLTKRFDFSVPEVLESSDLFFGNFQRSTQTRRIYTFKPSELDLANSVKWAIESATKMRCVFKGGELRTAATAATANRLKKIAEHIAGNFRTLLQKFSAVDGVSVSDRAAFVMGLYDGMMNESRSAGQRLPGPARVKKMPKGKKAGGICSPSLHIHPYTVAVDLGKQIRFSAPSEEIAAELDAILRGHLSGGQTQPD